MFSKESTKKQQSAQRNVISENTTFLGEIVSDGNFRIDGTLEGSINTKGKIIIGASGVFTGKMKAAEAEIEGKFTGDITVSGVLSLKSSAIVSGDIVAGQLASEPGAFVNANCSMKTSVKELNKKENLTLEEKSA